MTHTAVLYRAPRHRYPEVRRAEGSWLYDDAGRRWLDMSGGAAVSCLGHAHPDVVQAICEQARTLAFAHTAFFTHEPQEQLAARIRDRFGDPRALVYFCSGGSEANETALKMAWQYWAARGEPRRKLVISREHSYHGNTLGTLSVSGNPQRRAASAAPLLDWPRIAPCYPLREQSPGEALEAYALRAADTLEDAIEAAGSGQVAAFICEPVVGSSLGVVPAATGYLARVRSICDRHGLPWIADEIMCGSGRTGTWFAFEHDGVRPDIVTLAKGIAGGYQPLAATVVAGHVADVLREAGFVHGHTYIGHPVACAAGLAVQHVIERDGLLARCRELGATFGARLRERFCDHPHVAEVRGRGLFWGLELVSDRDTLAGFSAAGPMDAALRNAALEEGLVCYPGNILLNGEQVPHVMLAPPMTASEDELSECVERLARTLRRQFGT